MVASDNPLFLPPSVTAVFGATNITKKKLGGGGGEGGGVMEEGEREKEKERLAWVERGNVKGAGAGRVGGEGG